MVCQSLNLSIFSSSAVNIHEQLRLRTLFSNKFCFVLQIMLPFMNTHRRDRQILATVVAGEHETPDGQNVVDTFVGGGLWNCHRSKVCVNPTLI